MDSSYVIFKEWKPPFLKNRPWTVMLIQAVLGSPLSAAEAVVILNPSTLQARAVYYVFEVQCV